MSIFDREGSVVKADAPPVHSQNPHDPTAMFARLVDARDRNDAAEGRRLTVELRRLGWLVVPIEPLARWAEKGGR